MVHRLTHDPPFETLPRSPSPAASLSSVASTTDVSLASTMLAGQVDATTPIPLSPLNVEQPACARMGAAWGGAQAAPIDPRDVAMADLREKLNRLADERKSEAPLPPPLRSSSPRLVEGDGVSVAVPGSPVARARTTLTPLTRNQRKRANKKKNMLAEAAKLEELPEEEKELEENRQRQANLEKRFHVKAHRRHVQRDVAKEKAEREGAERFKEDMSARERQKKGEEMRKKQKAEEAAVERERERMQGVKDRIEALERRQDWKETMEEAKVTGRERFMEEEAEKGREDEEVLEAEWQELAAEYDVLLPGVHLHIPESLDFVERHACKVDRSGDKPIRKPKRFKMSY